MAKRMKDAVDDGGAGEDEPQELDVAKRKKILKGAKKEVERIDRELETIAADKKQFSKERADIFRDLKTKLGMKRKDVEFSLRVLGLEGDDLDSTISTMQEIFETFELKEQLDFFRASAPTKNPDEDRPSLQ